MNEFEKQFEMFLRDGAARCYLDKGVLVYEFDKKSIPCLHPNNSVEVKIDGSCLWLVFYAEGEPIVGEGFDFDIHEITCSFLYVWCEKENLNWLAGRKREQ